MNELLTYVERKRDRCQRVAEITAAVAVGGATMFVVASAILILKLVWLR